MQDSFDALVLLNPTHIPAWRLQDAKVQFSALVDKAMLGIPQHVTRSGKRAVVVLCEQDFEALQRSAAAGAVASLSFVDHLMAIPKTDIDALEGEQRLDVQTREVNFS